MPLSPDELTLPDPALDVILQKVRGEVAIVTGWRYLGQPVFIRFPLANTATDVRHLLAEVPDGFVVVDADARIKRSPGVAYGKELASLQADMANASAVLQFGVLREGITDVNPA